MRIFRAFSSDTLATPQEVNLSPFGTRLAVEGFGLPAFAPNVVANFVGKFSENRANREGLILDEVRDEVQAGIRLAIRSAAKQRRY